MMDRAFDWSVARTTVEYEIGEKGRYEKEFMRVNERHASYDDRLRIVSNETVS